MTKRIFTTVFSFVFVLLIYWLGSGEFERGFKFACIVVFAASIGIFVYCYPGWKE